MVKMADIPARRYTIENDVILPRKVTTNKRPSVYAFAEQMKIGQSFVIAKSEKLKPNNLGRHTGFKFTQRSISETELRVWRIE